MLRGCLVDLLRFALGALALLCVALLVATWWLGPEHTAVWVVALDAGTELDVNVWGPSPDLRVVLWRQQPATGANYRLGALRLRAQPLALATIVLCLVVAALDCSNPRRQAPLDS